MTHGPLEVYGTKAPLDPNFLWYWYIGVGPDLMVGYGVLVPPREGGWEKYRERSEVPIGTGIGTTDGEERESTQGETS